MIYLDLILVVNFLYDFVILYAVAIILRRKTSLKRIFTSATVGQFSLIFLLFPFNSIIFILSKIIISLIMVVISFKFSSIKYTLNNLFYLYTISVFLGGIFYLIDLKLDNQLFHNNGLFINFLLLVICLPLIISVLVKQLKQLKNNYANYYHLDIYLRGRVIKNIIGYLDSGNKLEDPYFHRPIILIDKKMIDFNYYEDNLLLVPYDTINSHGLLKCLIPEKIYIDNIDIKEKFLIGISEDKIKIEGVDCLLHSKLLERI